MIPLADIQGHNPTLEVTTALGGGVALGAGAYWVIQHRAELGTLFREYGTRFKAYLKREIISKSRTHTNGNGSQPGDRTRQNSKDIIYKLALPPDVSHPDAGAVISGEVRDNALLFIQRLEHEAVWLEDPDLTPSDGGTIYLEWESHKGRACLEIGRTKYSFVLQFADGRKSILRAGDATSIDADILELIRSQIDPSAERGALLN